MDKDRVYIIAFTHMYAHTYMPPTHTHKVPSVSFEEVEVSVSKKQEFFTVGLVVDGFIEADRSIEVILKSRDDTAIGKWNKVTRGLLYNLVLVY